MTPQDLLDLYKSQAAIARAAGITQPSVAEWFALGVVPSVRQFQFEVLTEGRLKAERPGALAAAHPDRIPKSEPAAAGGA